MKEIGFWDYTCPTHGSLERYTERDWDMLLDDMADGGFNSLVLGIKWLTTGYRSRYDWLDQDPLCTAIASDNALIHYALQGARERGICTRLLVVGTIYPTHEFKLPYGAEYWGPQFMVYDVDCPGLMERMELLFSEIVDLFGEQADGIVVELEFCDGEAPHRVPVYNEWATKNNRPDFSTIKNYRLESRFYPYTHWRDFTTARRIDALKQIEGVIRSHGYTGELSSIIEIDNQPTAVLGNVTMHMLQQALPHWSVVTYDSIYDRRRNRLATMDMCIEQPRAVGFDVHYLTRGVMTFGIPAEMPPTRLHDQWRMSLEDALTHQPESLWFMGSDACLDGYVCSNVKLPHWGFDDGRTARYHLMQMAREMGALSLSQSDNG